MKVRLFLASFGFKRSVNYKLSHIEFRLATRMQVFDFMMEYFSLDAEEENEIEAIISDIPE